MPSPTPAATASRGAPLSAPACSAAVARSQMLLEFAAYHDEAIARAMAASETPPGCWTDDLDLYVVGHRRAAATFRQIVADSEAKALRAAGRDRSAPLLSWRQFLATALAGDDACARDGVFARASTHIAA